MKAGKIALVALLLAAAAPAEAQSRKAGTNEIYLGPTFTSSKSYSFDGGTSAKTDTGTGVTFGYAYNFSPHLAAGVDIGWSEQNYRATVQPGPGNPNAPSQISGRIDSRIIRFNGTYNILESNFTPFVSAGAGWTYIDTNIPSGLPQSVCWYYPWYGSYCGTYVPTQTTTKFSYNLGVGLRLDYGKGVFRLGANSQSVDFGGSYGSTNVIQYRLDFGVKF